MKKRYLAIATALLLCLVLCLSGCTAPSDHNANALPIYNPGKLTIVENSRLPDMESTELSSARPYYGIGSNKQLEGLITVVFVFVDDYSTYWTQTGIDFFMQYQADPALDYLVGEAAKWDVELDFRVLYHSSLSTGSSIRYEGNIGTGLDGGYMSSDVMEHVAADIGYTTPEKMMAAYRELYDTEVAFINVFNTAGRAYTYMQVTAPEVEYAEHCIMFAKAYAGEATSVQSRSSTIAHEFLHLYGAEDFYTPDERARYAQNIYSNEIMLIAATSLSQVSLSEVTSFLVGWHDNIPAMCLTEAWKSGYTS